MNAADFDAAQKYFELAIEKDPSYAQAYAGLQSVWITRGLMRLVPDDVATSKGREYVNQIVALDEDSWVAHRAQAGFKTWDEFDIIGAEPHWRRTIELNPNDANTQAYYAHFLCYRGRPEEALWHAERAIELDPYNPLYYGLYSMTLAYNRRWDDAIAARRTAESIQPGFGIGFSLGEYLFVMGFQKEALAGEKKNISNDPERLEVFERGLAEGGYEGVWRATADLRVARYNVIDVGPGAPSAFGIAFLYLKSGDYDLAVEWFWKAYEDHVRDMPYVGRPTVYDRLHSHPRYRELLRKLNLPVDLLVPSSKKR